MNTKIPRAMCIGASIATVVALSACTGSFQKNRADMAESELDALQEAYGEDELTPDAITALRNMIAALMGRADITPADLQALRDQVAMLEGRADITPRGPPGVAGRGRHADRSGGHHSPRPPSAA